MSHKLTIRHNKLTIAFLVFVFVGPIVVAHALYHFRAHIHFNTLEKGQLFSPPLPTHTLPFFNTSFLGKWQLIHINNENCQPNCPTPEILNRIHLALGKEKHRVTYRSVSLAQNTTHNTILPASSHVLTPGSIHIVDPKGWLIMYYPSPVDPQGILKDIKRLLRFSHGD